MTHYAQQTVEQLKTAALLAVKNEDAPAVGIIADNLRFKYGMNYDQVMRWFESAGADRDAVEALFYEADMLEGQS
jgi:hypothetical protein